MARVKRALDANPHVKNTFFVEKFNAYLKEFLIPTLNIEKYWVTFEWQKRNSVHAHCLFWIRDAPDILEAMKTKDESKLQEACD